MIIELFHDFDHDDWLIVENEQIPGKYQERLGDERKTDEDKQTLTT